MGTTLPQGGASTARAPVADRVRGLALLAPERVEPSASNWRTHDAGQKARMAAILGAVGSVAGLVVWVPDDAARASLRALPGAAGFDAWIAAFAGKVRILDGHMRKSLLGRRPIRVQVTDLDAREAALVLATFDPIGAQAGRDDALLRDLLGDVGRTGSTADELLDDLRGLLGDAPPPVPDDEEPPAIDPTDELLAKWAALGCVAGSLWEVPSADGQRVHRVLCGDARKPEDVARLMAGRLVNVAFTSPPYASQRKYDPASGFRPIKPAAYVEWFEPVQANVRSVLAPDGSWFVNIKPASEGAERLLYVNDLVLAHARAWDWKYIDDLCWRRQSLPGDPAKMRKFKNGFELIYHFALSIDFRFRPLTVRHATDGAFAYADQKAAGRDISHRSQGQGSNAQSPVNQGPGLAFPSNVLDITGGANVEGHAAAFPVALPSFFVRAYSDPGDAIFDPFLGSGTTILAAEKTGRCGFGTEIAARYVAVTLERLTRAGLTPRRAE